MYTIFFFSNLNTSVIDMILKEKSQRVPVLRRKEFRRGRQPAVKTTMLG